MRIAVYGGSFDPVHVVHEAVPRDAAEVFDLVLVVPAYNHALKPDGHTASYTTRMAMTEAAFADDPRIVVSQAARWLWEREESTYSYDLLAMFQAQYPNNELFLLVGSDILGECHKWHRWGDILKEFGIFVVGREGSLDPTLDLYDRLDKTYPDVSATEIRRHLAVGESVEGLVSPAVMNFLGVYRSGG